MFGFVKKMSDKVASTKQSVTDRIKDRVSKVKRAIPFHKPLTVNNPVLSNKGGGDGSKFNPFPRPKSANKSSPDGSKLRAPRVRPEAHSRVDSPIREARVIPRNVSKVINKVSSKVERKRKDHD